MNPPKIGRRSYLIKANIFREVIFVIATTYTREKCFITHHKSTISSALSHTPYYRLEQLSLPSKTTHSHKKTTWKSRVLLLASFLFPVVTFLLLIPVVIHFIPRLRTLFPFDLRAKLAFGDVKMMAFCQLFPTSDHSVCKAVATPFADFPFCNYVCESIGQCGRACLSRFLIAGLILCWRGIS